MNPIDGDRFWLFLKDQKVKETGAFSKGLNKGLNIAISALKNKEITLPWEVDRVRHGRWVDRYGGKYANHLYECSECKGKALYNIEVDVLGKENLVQALSAVCPHCGARMDKKEG